MMRRSIQLDTHESTLLTTALGQQLLHDAHEVARRMRSRLISLGVTFPYEILTDNSTSRCENDMEMQKQENVSDSTGARGTVSAEEENIRDGELPGKSTTQEPTPLSRECRVADFGC
jgi:hypothetical protein